MRYLAVATCIVLGVIVLITRIPHAPTPAARVAFSSSTGTPGPTQLPGPLPSGAGDVSGAAPWVLSALPECFRQDAHRTGPAAFALAAVPRGLRQLPDGSGVLAADCSLLVSRGRVLVRRGADRFYVPAPARLLAGDGRLVLERRRGGRLDVRVYSYPAGVTVRYTGA